MINLRIESRRTILQLKEELRLLGALTQSVLLYQNRYLSNDELVDDYDNATLLIQSIASKKPDDDCFDPLYIECQDYYAKIQESLLRYDGTDTDDVNEHLLWLKTRAKIIKQAKYGDDE
jgi:hypothetical protein